MRAGLIVLGLLSVVGLLLWWLAGEAPPPPDFDASRGGADPAHTSAAERDHDSAPRVALSNPTEPTAKPPAPPAEPPSYAVRVELRGRVTDARSARPLAGAEIALPDGGATAVADGDGRYTIELFLADARIAVTCEHPGYLPARRVVWNRRVPAGGRVEPFDFELRPASEGATLVGRVADERGAPVRGARVQLLRTPPTRIGELPPAHTQAVESDGDGRFAFEALSPGRWNLLTEARGLEDHERAGLELPPGTRTDLGTIRLGRFDWARLTGRVVDAGGEPVPGVHLYVRQERGAREAASDDDGAFAVERIAPGSWPVSFENERAWSGLGAIEFGAGQTVERDVEIEGGTHFVGGTVFLGTVPGADLEVTAEVAGRSDATFMMWRTRTDGDGRFRLDGLPAGRLDLGFTRERPYASFEADGVAADRDDHRFDFPATPSPVTISGVVRDPAGTPIEGATVTPFEPFGDATRGRTGPDGRYAIEVVLSNDMTNAVVAEHPGYLSGRKVVMRDQVDPSGRVALDFTLPPTDQLGAVEGVVTGDRDLPLRDVTCVLRSRIEGWWVWRTETDSTGRFRCEGVPSGEFDLLLAHRDHREKKLLARLAPRETQSVAIRLEALRRFDGTVLVRGADGAPLAGVTVDVWRLGRHITSAITDAAGRATLRSLPEAEPNLSLSVEAPGYARHERALTVLGPLDKEVVLQLTRGSAVLEGVVVGADGKPRDRAEVVVKQPSNETAHVEAITTTDHDGRFRVEHLRDVACDLSIWTGSLESSYTARPGDGPVRIVVK